MRIVYLHSIKKHIPIKTTAVNVSSKISFFLISQFIFSNMKLMTKEIEVYASIDVYPLMYGMKL